MLKRELFLYAPSGKKSSDEEKEIFKNSTQQEVDRDLSSANLEKERYRKNINKLCDKCSEKEVCLEIYKAKRK
jgi:beta-mannanase